MSFFYYDVRSKCSDSELWGSWRFWKLNELTDRRCLFLGPSDSQTYKPKEHVAEELDALKIPQDRRDACKNHYAEFKKCIMVTHQTHSLLSWKRADQRECGYYFDHWNICRESNAHNLGMTSTLTNHGWALAIPHSQPLCIHLDALNILFKLFGLKTKKP